MTTEISAIPTLPRITSLDQFRGYSVAAMFIVNFLGGMAVTHQFLKHNNTHFSYADSIMPSFIFVCGIAYRMSFLKQSSAAARTNPYRRYLRRSFGLILLSLMLFGLNTKFANWSEITSHRMVRFVFDLIKADMWEVLAIIGAVQILLLPLIGRSTKARLLAFLAMGGLHFVLCCWFNYQFVYGKPNGLDQLLGTTGKRAWDGGFFGLLAWSQFMLAGTLVYDLAKGLSAGKLAFCLVLIGAVVMAVGYGMSCLTTLYDIRKEISDDQRLLERSPVLPDFSRAKGKDWKQLLADPPFVVPPPPSERVVNYWMMDKRIVTQSFVWFATGFAILLYALFVLCCDTWGGRLTLFDVFGKNPLAAYIINHMINHSVHAIVPKDSPLPWTLAGLAFAFVVTYLFVRFLDSKKLYLRL